MLSLKTNDEYLTEIGSRVRKRRLEKQLTQQEVADRAGVHVNSVRMLERKADVKLITLIQVLRALGSVQDIEKILSQPLPKKLEDISSAPLPKRIRKKKKR